MGVEIASVGEPAKREIWPAVMNGLKCRCPKCGKGNILKGNTAYGCSDWKNGCSFRLPFEFMGKKLSDAQVQSLLKKGETTGIKGFVKDGAKVNGRLKLDADAALFLEQ